MGKPMMLKDEDDRRIEDLRRKLGIKTKIQVLREALQLLEERTQRMVRVKRWKKAAGLVSKSSKEVLGDFRGYSRMKRYE